MWKEGAIRVGNSIFKFWVKHYDEGSQYGIDEGYPDFRIIKKYLFCIAICSFYNQKVGIMSFLTETIKFTKYCIIRYSISFRID